MRQLIPLYLFLTSTFSFAKEITLAQDVTVNTISSETISDIYFYPALLEPKITYSHYSTFDGDIIHNSKALGDEVTMGDVILKVRPHNPSYQQVALKSPSNGTIIQTVPKTQGTFRYADLLYEVSDLSHFQVKFQVPFEEKLLLTNEKSKLELIVNENSYPVIGLSLDVKVTPLGTIASSCVVKQTEDNKFLPGTLYNLRLTTPPRQAYLLPPNTIKYERQSTYIYTLQDKKIRKVPVTVSTKMYNGRYELLSTIDKDMQILFNNHRYLTEGQEISFTNI